MVTTEMPNLEIDRICSTLGRPLIACSTGKERSVSTSSGESAGASVITWTCTLVRSGTASTGKLTAEYTPRPATNAVAIRTRNRLFRDDSMMALSMADLPSDPRIHPPHRQPDSSLFVGLVLKD